MKNKINNLTEDIQTFNGNDTNLNIYFKKRFGQYNYIIIILLLILLTIFVFYQKSKIKDLEKLINTKIENLEHSNLILNQQLETIFYYLHNINNKSSIYQLLRPKDVYGKKKVRIGKEGDGGYVLLNDFENISIAYSFGICNDVSFDLELAEKNIDIFMYDHTIQKLPVYNKKFHWKKFGLTGKKINEPFMKTLKELIYENGHINEKNMILKLDIEESEWNVFSEINSAVLKQFKYILVEFHFNNIYESQYLKILKKLNRTHQIFHLHCNNCGLIVKFDGINICNPLEVSFVIKDNNRFIESFDIFPIKNIDYKNCDNLIDFNNIINIYKMDNLINKK